MHILIFDNTTNDNDAKDKEAESLAPSLQECDRNILSGEISKETIANYFTEMKIFFNRNHCLGSGEG